MRGVLDAIPAEHEHLFFTILKEIIRLPETGEITTRQLTILLHVKHEPDEQRRTIRGIARELQVSKPVVTRAIDTLKKLHLVEKILDPNDRRSVFVKFLA